MSIELAKQLTHDQWLAEAQAALASPKTGLYIDGAFVEAQAGDTFKSINPTNGESIAVVSAAQSGDVDRAVASALATFRSGTWSQMPPRERMGILYRWADLIEENAVLLSVLDTLDMGKPITDMLDVDIPSVTETIRFMAECIDKVHGDVTATESDVLHLVMREPLGVIGAITPWNYPLLMAVWKLAPALAAGNTVVLKPAEQSPLSALRLAELLSEAGAPGGTLNVINGFGESAGKALALHNDVAKVSFTGSTEVGKLMLQYAGQSNMKRVALECGGKSPQIFLADLEDLDTAVESAYNGIYSNMGEVCNAGSRLLVDRAIYDDFVERFVATGAQAYIPGDPLDPATNMGPLVTKQAQKRVLSYIEVGQSEGARLCFGGDVPAGLEQGAYVSPTLFADVGNNMTIAREEIFGPVAAVIPFDGLEEAVEIANDTVYGLAAGVWTSKLKHAQRLIREVQAGVIWVNCFDEGDMTQPFGGYKQSGNAKDKCLDSFLSYTQTKSAWIRS